MAVAFRAESHSIASTANANPGEPAGTVSGDVLVCLILVIGTSAAPSLPTGWTLLYTETSTNGTTTNGFKAKVGYIVRGGSAAATTFTNAAGYREAHIIGFSGVDNTTPIDSQSALGSNFNSTANPNPPATTAVSSAAMAVTGIIHWAGSQVAWTAPAGYAIRSDNTTGNDGSLASKLLSASGSEDPAAFTGNGTGAGANGWNGFTITLAPAAAGGTDVSLTGVAGTVAVAAPAGSVATIRNAAVTAVAGTVAVAAPAGTVTATGNVALTGVAGTITVAAPAGTVTTIQNVSLTGATGTVTVTAPAGTVTPIQVVSLTGAAGAVTVAAPAGSVSTGANVTLTGVAGTVTVAAPAGSVATVQNVSLVGSPGQVAVVAPAGSVATVQSALLTGAAGTVVVTAPAGTISISVNLDGAEFTFGHPFTDWDTRSPLTEWDSGFPVDEWASGTLITDWTAQPAMTGWTSGQPQTD